MNDRNFGTPEVRAIKGAAVMDIAQPGWAALINADKLDLAEASVCIGGQLAQRSHHTWISYLQTVVPAYVRADEEWHVAYGFAPLSSLDNPGTTFERDGVALTAAWRTEIADRKAGAARVAATEPAVARTMPSGFARAVRLARELTEPGEPNPEYIRGQCELIMDMFGLGHDDWRDEITAMISEGRRT